MKSIFTILSKKAISRIKNPATLLFLFLLQFCCSIDVISQSTQEFKTSTDTLVVYSDVPGATSSDKYTIRVKPVGTNDWIEVFAHYTYNRAAELGGVSVPKTNGTTLNTTVYNYAKHTSAWSHTYGNIEINKNHPIEVEIATKAGFKVRNLDIFKATVHPAQKASVATLSNGKIYFTVTNPGQLVIDINGQMDDFNAAINGGIGAPVHAISLFVNPVIKKPTLTNPRTYYVEPTTTRAMLDNVAPATFDTIYYKPGVHDLGKDIKIYPGKVVYIPGDALIYGNMNNLGVPNGGFSKNGENIRVYGYGTISGAKITHNDYVVNPTGSYKGFEIENGLNWKCEGIANIDSPNHSVYTIGGTNGLFNWVKVITWRANGDGIGGFEPTLNCFIRTQDDCSYAKGYKKNCTFWKDANAALFHLATIPENTTEPIIMEDCDVIYARLRDAVGNTGGGFQQRGEGTAGQRNINVIFRNIRIHDKLTNMSIVNLVSYQGSNANAPTEVGASYKGFLFQNISIAGMAPNNKQRILGCAAAPWYGGLIFDNLTIGGVKVTKDNYQTYINTNEFVKYLLFEMPKDVTLTTIADPVKGSITRDPDQSTYLETSTVTLSAKGKAGYIFSNWTGDITGTTNPIDVVVDKNMTITANFIPFDFTNPVIINAPGTSSFTIPVGVTSITAKIWGAGGAGGSASNGATTVQSRGGGAAGGGFATVTRPVTPGQVITYTLGAGGIAAPDGFANNTIDPVQNGGNSSITLNGTVIALAQGGSGGRNIADTFASGTGVNAPKSGNIGDTVFYGGNGAAANSNGTGGGGGSAGESGNGGDAAPAATGVNSMGLAGAGGGANGGVGLNSTNVGNPGGTPGAGGSGAAVRVTANTSLKGGDGANGAVRFTFVTVVPTFTAPLASYCYGESLPALPTISNNGITGTWSPALNNLATTTYTFTPNAGEITSLTAKLTITIGSVTTWNGSSWSNGVPTASTKAVIAGNYQQSANLTACSLEITGTAVVTVPAGFNFTISGKITVAPTARFIMSSNSNLVQIDDIENEGVVAVKRNGASLLRLDYEMWSSPVTGTQTLANFSALTTNTPTSRFYIYNFSLNRYDAINASLTPFALATGYLIRMPNEKPGSLGTTTPYYLRNESINFQGEFSGRPNNGTITLNGLAADKYHAIGNPYPSTISANAFLDGNTTDGTLYLWRKTNGGAGTAYATYTKAGGTAPSSGPSGLGIPNGTIQVGQGFIVKTGSSSTSLTFTNTMRTSDTANQIFKTKKAVDKSRVWLTLSKSGEQLNQILVAYLDGATIGVDNMIDGKYLNDSGTALTSIINGEEYTIQGRPSFDVTDNVDLSFKTELSGSYTISLDSYDGLFENGQDVYLVDKFMDTETNLKTEAYNFIANAGLDNTRFSLKYQKNLDVNMTTFSENNLNIYSNKGDLFVNSAFVPISNIKIYDLLGKLLAEQKNTKTTAAILKGVLADNQVFIVKVVLENKTVVTKKVLN
jgi:uncharacterized repeat protein (TIGR02543 family)